MTDLDLRKDALELLARGKISIDEAVALIDQSQGHPLSEKSDEPIYRAEMSEDLDIAIENDIEVDDVLETAEDSLVQKQDLQIDEIEAHKNELNGKQPRWLRIRVAQLETGKNKVAVNIPFGMVKFGLGVARVFSPEIKGVDLDEINDMFSHAETGLLVDVQDQESNERVQIYFE